MTNHGGKRVQIPDLQTILPDLPQVAFLYDLVPALWARPEVFGLWLDGSMGRGEADLYSDVDLYIGVETAALEEWLAIDIAQVFGEHYAAHRLSKFADDLFVFHLYLNDGYIYDVAVQGRDRAVSDAKRLVLVCEDAQYQAALEASKPRVIFEPKPVDPAVIEDQLVRFWMNADKGRKLSYRGYDYILHSGLIIFQQMLLRLKFMDFTGMDCGDIVIPTIHGLKAASDVLQVHMGEELWQLLGKETTTRETMMEAHTQLRHEVVKVGRSLHETYDFEYPDALERVVMANWEAFMAELPRLHRDE